VFKNAIWHEKKIFGVAQMKWWVKLNIILDTNKIIDI